MEAIKELSYALDTFYFLVSGALVMWMAAGFAMLEAGLVRAKSTTEILTKNVALYSIACIMYLLCGYQIMYGGSDSSVIPGLDFLIGADNSVEDVLAGGEDAPYLMRRVQERGGRSCYFIIGADLADGHHTPRFDFDETAIATGVRLFAGLAERVCA